MKTNAGTVLMFECHDSRYGKMKMLFAKLRLKMRMVEPEKYHLTLRELAEGTGEPGESQPAIPESMLVFCGLDDAFLDQVLKVLRAARLGINPIKAVLTDTNQEWTPARLYGDLCREREAIRQQAESGNA